MSLWLAGGISIACLLIGYAIACWTEGQSRGSLEVDLYREEIKNARLEREAHL
jgi:hypothetical protein